jgi:hypothetical protein
MGPIRYRKGYKYQLAMSMSGHVPIRPKGNIVTEFIELTRDGYMTIKKGYAWDGASGPTFNTKNSQTPSLVHDAFCQLIRQGYLPQRARAQADKFFYDMLRDRKMWKIRARIWYQGVRIGSLHKQKAKRTFTAP